MNTKSSDSTPFQQVRRNTQNENNSILGLIMSSIDISSKKPKFLQKLTSYQNNEDPHKKNLIEDFSPLQMKVQSKNQNAKVKTYSSNWGSPNRIDEKNTFILSDQSSHVSILNANQGNQMIMPSNLSRNNSNGMVGTLSNNVQRTSINTAADSYHQSIIYQANQLSATQSLLMTQQKSRN